MTNPSPGDWRLAVYGSRSASPAYRARPRSVDRERVVAAQGNDCLYCGIPIGTVIARDVPTKYRYTRREIITLQPNWDHFVPYAYLLRNPRTNWVLACNVCNSIKRARMFSTVEEARRAILPEREARGYEPVREVMARVVVSMREGNAELFPEEMSNRQTAGALGITPRQLNRWRERGCGPEWVGFGHTLRYKREAVQAWLRAQAGDIPAEQAGPAESEAKEDAMPRTQTRHDPECRIPHDPDLDCDEAELLLVEEARHAKWDCTRSPSRTQPFHHFDDTDWSGECVYGCGVTRDQIDGDLDA